MAPTRCRCPDMVRTLHATTLMIHLASSLCDKPHLYASQQAADVSFARQVCGMVQCIVNDAAPLGFRNVPDLGLATRGTEGQECASLAPPHAAHGLLCLRLPRHGAEITQLCHLQQSW